SRTPQGVHDPGTRLRVWCPAPRRRGWRCGFVGHGAEWGSFGGNDVKGLRWGLMHRDDILNQRLHNQRLAGVHFARPEEMVMAQVLGGAGIDADGLRLSYIMMHAELEGLICSGASRGKQQTYALLEERAPQARILGRDEALTELARRFFAGHGPATLKDFVW